MTTTDRAVSSNVGLVLLIALTVSGAGAVVAIGGTALDDVQHRTSVDRAEHAMTLLDARAAVVGLGEGSAQTVNLGRTSGDYAVDSDAGWLRIDHANYTANETETIYNASLGSVSHRTGGTTIAYQGGGVWRHRSGGTSMVSPPEFHYRGTTLTLPVLRVRSDDAAGGSATATIRSDGPVTRVYPDEDTTYSGSSDKYLNPVRNGTVSVTVHSEYYRGWAEYFRTRTTGNVSVDDDDRTATVVLEATDPVGTFRYPDEGDAVPVRGIAAGHSVTEFTTSIRAGNGNGGNNGNGNGGTFNNLYASYYIDEGDRKYEVIVEVPSGAAGHCNGNGGSDTLTMDIYYHDNNTTEGVHRWSNDSIPADSGPVQLVCGDDDPVIEIDFTSSAQTLTYGESNVGGSTETEIDWDDLDDDPTPTSVTFAHDGDDDETTTHADGDAQTLRILTRHYFALFGSDFDLRVHHGPGESGTSRINAANSGGVLRYDTRADGSVITYLHVTENNVTVELN